jgi:uncharacterized protein (TIGR02246 family)
MTTDDIVAIHQLLARYGHAADAADRRLLAEVFTDDAVFDSGASDMRMEGLEAIAAWFALGKPPHPPSHHTTNIEVYEDGDVVRVRSKYLAINSDTGLPRSGDYNDIVVRTEAGWRIRFRRSDDRIGGYAFKQ